MSSNATLDWKEISPPETKERLLLRAWPDGKRYEVWHSADWARAGNTPDLEYFAAILDFPSDSYVPCASFEEAKKICETDWERRVA